MSLSEILIIGVGSVLSVPVVAAVSLIWSDLLLQRAIKSVWRRPGDAVVLLAWANAAIATYLAILCAYLTFN